MNMRKLSAMLVLALFVISVVPAVFAHEGDDGSDESTETTEGKESLRDKMLEEREKMRDTKTRVLEAHEKVMKARASFLDARIKIRSGQATTVDKQDFLLAAADKVIELLNDLKVKVEASDDEDKAETLAEIDASIEAMTSAKATVEGIDTETATREEIRAAAGELRDAWNDAQKVLRKGAGHVVNKRVGNVIQRMDHMDDKLDKILERLAAKGYDVSAAAALTAEFDAKIESAEAHHEKSKELFEAGSIQEANVEMRAAMADLKDAHNLLKDIVKSLRESTQGNALAEAEEQADDSIEHADDESSDTEEADDNESDADEEDEEDADDAEDDHDDADDHDDEEDENEDDDVEVEVNATVDANVTV